MDINTKKHDWIVFTLKPWAIQTGGQFFKLRYFVSETTEINKDEPTLFVPLFYSITEFLLLPYIFTKELKKELKIIVPKKMLDTPLGNYISQRGLESYSVVDEPKRWYEDLQKNENCFLWFPQDLFMSKEQYLPYHLGIKGLDELMGKIQAEYDLLWNLPTKTETDENLKPNHKYIYIVKFQYYPSVFEYNPLESICDISYEELASGVLKAMEIGNTLLDDKHLIEIRFIECQVDSFRQYQGQRGYELFQKFEERFSSNFETILFKFIQTLLPLKYSWKSFRNRFLIFLQHIVNKQNPPFSAELEKIYDKILTGEHFQPWEKAIDYLQIQGLCEKQTNAIRISPLSFNPCRFLQKGLFTGVSFDKQGKKIANRIKWTPDVFLSKKLASNLHRLDVEIFEDDYTRAFHTEWSKDAEVGKPFFKYAPGARIGIVISHGYLSAPMEIRALAEYLYRNGYTVYGVRLKGHGTSPLDLANTAWTDWYESINRGVACLHACCEKIFLCGFSAGGCLMLSASANKRSHIAGVISISAPLKLQNYAIHLVPTIATLNVVLKKFGGDGWELFDHRPENPHINYQKNPLGGLHQLRLLMERTEELLPQITVPALIIQGSNDTTVNPESAQIIFQNICSEQKQLIMFNRSRHGILNGPGSEEIFFAVENFISKISKSSI